MSLYQSYYHEGFGAYVLKQSPADNPYLGNADINLPMYWFQGWTDAFNTYEGTAGFLLPGGSDTAGQGGGLGNSDPVVTVNDDGTETVTTTPRPTIAPDNLGSVPDGNIIPLPIVGLANVAGPLNVGGPGYYNQQLLVDDQLIVRLAILGLTLGVTGLPGADTPIRLVGGNPSGQPTLGPFLAGDIAVDLTGAIWLCTEAGTPGNWRRIGIGGGYQATIQLTWTPPSDYTNTAYTGATWTNLYTAQTFEVENGGSVVEVDVAGSMLAFASASQTSVATRLLIDGVTAYPLGMGRVEVGGQACNPFAGAIPVRIDGLSVGTHTLIVQFRNDIGDSFFFLRGQTETNGEHLRLTVLEYKPPVDQASILTDGNPLDPQIVYANGDVIYVPSAP